MRSTLGNIIIHCRLVGTWLRTQKQLFKPDKEGTADKGRLVKMLAILPYKDWYDGRKIKDMQVKYTWGDQYENLVNYMKDNNNVLPR